MGKVRPWVLIDLSFLAHRALHSVGFLSHEDLPTGVIFGFFNQLRQVCEDPRLDSNKVAIFCDSYGSLRRKEYPKYKEKRRKKDVDEEQAEMLSVFYDQVDLLRDKLLPAIGFPVFQQEGLESDDLLAVAAQQLLLQAAFGGPLPVGVIVTADGDLYQCITPAVHWYDPMRRIYHTPTSFEQLKGVAPKLWGQVKVLAGCSTDNVPGVPGVGEKTAIQHLLGKLPAKSKKAQAILSPEGIEIAARNRKLVLLPRPETKQLDLQEPRYQPEVFFKACKRYGLASFLKDEKGWRAFFRGPPTFIPRKRGEARKERWPDFPGRRVVRIRRK